MKPNEFENLLDLFFDDKKSKKVMKKLGITEKELNRFIDELLNNPQKKHYNRIFTSDEKRVMTTEAFGYLVKLLMMKSINKELFEQIINLSMQLNVFLRRKINRRMMDDIVNYIIFSGQEDITVKDLLDIFFVNDIDESYKQKLN